METNYDFTKLLDTMSEMTNQYFPEKKISCKQCKIASNLWITLDILNAIKSKDKLNAKYLKKFNLLLQLQKYFENFFRESSNSADTWKYINQLICKQTNNRNAYYHKKQWKNDNST